MKKIIFFIALIIASLIAFDQAKEIAHFDLIQRLSNVKEGSEARMLCILSLDPPLDARAGGRIIISYDSVRRSVESLITLLISDLERKRHQKIYEVVYDNARSVGSAYTALLGEVEEKYDIFISITACEKVMSTELVSQSNDAPDTIKVGGLKNKVIRNVTRNIEHTRLRSEGELLQLLGRPEVLPDK